MDSTLSLKNYIDAVGDSASRARTVVYIIIVASVVAYGTWQMDWTDDRVHVTANAIYYGMWDPRIQKLPSVVTWDDVQTVEAFKSTSPASSAYASLDPPQKPPIAKKLPAAASSGDKLQAVQKLQTIVSSEDFRQCQRAFSSSTGLKFTNLDEMEKYQDSLIDVRTRSHLNFQIPVFGTVFDINDLGLVSGFAFTMIMALLRSSLFRHVQNLKLTFEVAKQQDRISGSQNESLLGCYNLMSMVQVLTVPPQRGNQEIWPWKVAPKLLYFLPILVQVAITLDDYNTYRLGDILNPTMNLNQFVLEAIFCVVIFALTYSSLLIAIDQDREWSSQAKLLFIV